MHKCQGEESEIFAISILSFAFNVLLNILCMPDPLQHSKVNKSCCLILQERALSYLSSCIDQVNSFGDILQLVIVELIYKVIAIFSSPEPSGSQGELIVYPCSGVRPSSVRRPSVVHHFQRSSPLKPLGQSKPNFT